ncbi:MAG: GHMP kinase [Crenarchaeota archaeon]|nr:GHMP kinase [Thermoproteota archaeon]
MKERVAVRAPSHVHLGNFDLNGEYGRLFGTIGFTLEEPHVEIEVERGDHDVIEEPHGYRSLIAEVVEKCREKFKITYPLSIKVRKAFRRGVGLGLTTSLTLAIVYAISRVEGKDIDVIEIAPEFGRGTVSALGTYAFKLGGMIVDAGFRIGNIGRVPPLIYRGEIPRRWHFIVAVPNRVPEKVVEIKRREHEILNNLPKMSPETSGKLCRIVLTQLIPSVEEEDIETFGKAITEFSRTAGEYWAPFQEGTYCTKEVEKGIKIMLEEGCTGAAQSCWGPTFYGVADSYRACERVKKRLKEELNIEEIYITHVDNTGARIL